MEGDFRRPARRADDIIGGRRPQPSHRPRPVQVTDLRAQPHAPAHHPARPQPAPLDYQSSAHHQSQPRPTTAELATRGERSSKAKKPSRLNLYRAAAALLIIIIAALFWAGHNSAKKPAGPFPASISGSQINIPVYYPVNLPSGFQVSGSKIVKQNVLSYAVKSADNYSYYVNIQPVPAGYDFAAFDKRFTVPTTYQTAIGSATAGVVNNQMICSINAGKSWVLINSTAINSLQNMLTISKSLKPASL